MRIQNFISINFPYEMMMNDVNGFTPRCKRRRWRKMSKKCVFLNTINCLRIYSSCIFGGLVLLVIECVAFITCLYIDANRTPTHTQFYFLCTKTIDNLLFVNDFVVLIGEINSNSTQTQAEYTNFANERNKILIRNLSGNFSVFIKTME